MPEIPDFDRPAPDTAAQTSGRSRRSGLERIPVFDAADSVDLQVEILKETYDELEKIIRDNEWELEEGLRTVMLTGLGYLDAKQRLDKINASAVNGDGQAAKHMEDMLKDLAAYHSMYSVMKFKAFKLYKINQVLEFNVSGLRATESMWEGWAERMRRDHAELQAEVLRLRSMLSEFQVDTGEDTVSIPVVEQEQEEIAIAYEGGLNLADLYSSPEFDLPEETPPDRTFWQRLRGLFSGR